MEIRKKQTLSTIIVEECNTSLLINKTVDQKKKKLSWHLLSAPLYNCRGHVFLFRSQGHLPRWAVLSHELCLNKLSQIKLYTICLNLIIILEII